MKRIYIVTGASGFLGNNIIRILEHVDNAEVRTFVLNGESISSLNNLKCLFIMVMSQRMILLILFLMVVMAQKSL